ncbi:tail fiber domain-containing protein [Shigella flexneri]|nr:tail fiber domain-containing protein [Shigella flexneri]UMV17629.1 tail fiber domain-containing protein [Shigella flexneri]
MFAGKKSAQIREILISESTWEEMTCLFAPSLGDTSGLYPAADNSIGIGLPSNRWTAVYAATGSIQTSDGRVKCDERGLNEAELATAMALKKIIKAYRFTDAVNMKGDKARIHFGVIAQEVIEAFSANGLDAFDYGMVCYDEWDEVIGSVDDSGFMILPT